MRPSFMMAASLRYFYTSFVVLTALFVTIGHGGNYKCPSACSCLGSMVDCSKQGLTSVPDDLPIWVTILELSFNGIPAIVNGTFKNLYKLEELDLSNNKLTSLNTSVLEGLPKLRSLKLSHNQLTVLPTLPKDSNLTHLILHHNRISEIQRQAVDHLLRLRTLDLSHNRIRHLRNDTFTQHPTLHQLYLNNNRLETMQVGCLDNITALQWLRLSKNKLQQLPKNLFARLSQLKYLELNRNRLAVIDGLSFQGLGSLLTLKLRRNNIHTLLDGAFWGLERLQNLHLDHNNITAITKGWMYGLKTLQQLLLSHNYINKIEDDSWDSCRVLRHFQLSHNDIVAIKETTFADLAALQYLFLDYNRISYISDSAFHHLVALQTLELNNNEISWTIENTKGAFEGLNSVTRLGLNSNRIKSVTKRAFQGLEQLKQLHLADNAISTIQANAFESLTALQELSVNSTSLVCDCQLAWFPEWLRQRNFETSLIATCAHPEALKGQSIFDVDIADFKCSDFPLPIIVKEPESQMALKDGNISLECVAASSMDSPMTIEWKKDHIVLPSKLVQNFERVGDDNVVMFTSRLHIEHVGDEDSGDYQCVISNTLGASYSQRAHISVHVFPTFVKTPEDKTVRAGTTARLDCAATGQPPPQISWQKDGGSDFPAARERRMYVKPTDDAFFIVQFRSTDQGVYSCTATNAAGTIMANVTLSVLETPAFVKPMENHETEEGKTTVLECRASGSPKPRVKWLKDGEPLHLTQRHFFTAENQLLIIVETLPTDAGVYTCIMSNTLGTERGTSRLQVISLNGPGNGSDSMSMLDDETTTTGIIIIAVVCCVVGTSLIWVIIIYQTRKKTEEYSSTPTEDTMLGGADMMPTVPHFYTIDKDGNSPNVDLSLTTSSFGRPSSGVDHGLENGMVGSGPGRHRGGAIFPSDIDTNGHSNTDHLLDTCQQFNTCQQGAADMPDADQSSCLSSQSTPSSRSGGPLLLHTFQPPASHHKGFVSPIRDWDSGQPSTAVAVVRAMPHATGANTNQVFMYAAEDDGDDMSDGQAGCSLNMIDRRRTVGDAVFEEDRHIPHQSQLHSSCSRLHHCSESPPGGSTYIHRPDLTDGRDDAICRPLAPPGDCLSQPHIDHRGSYSPTPATVFPPSAGHSIEVIPDRTLSCSPDTIESCSLPHSQSDCDASVSSRPQLCVPVT